MASIDEFEDHCWKDVVPEADMRIYAPYARDTAVGPHAALLAIDLYNQVYEGGAKPPVELAAQYPSQLRHLCAPRHRTDQTADRRRPPRGTADLLLHPGCSQQCATGGCILDQAQGPHHDA